MGLHRPRPPRAGRLTPTPPPSAHHLHHLYLGADAEVVQEHLQVLLHLDAVVILLGHREDAHAAFPPHLGAGWGEGWPVPPRRPPCSPQPHARLHALCPSPRPVPTLCCRSRKGSSMRRPPSCTTHHTSMFPSPRRSWFCGNRSTFLATSRACCAAVVSRTVSGEAVGALDGAEPHGPTASLPPASLRGGGCGQGHRVPQSPCPGRPRPTCTGHPGVTQLGAGLGDWVLFN